MRFIAPALLALACAAATPAVAGDPKPQAEEKAEKEQAREEKKICRRITSMGSRRAERICMTKAEWREYNNGN